MSEERIDITVIMPALNEEKNIEAALRNVLEAFEMYEMRGEIIVVDDGSGDRTREIVLDFIQKDRRVRGLRHIRPRGIGFSFWEGLEAARGEAVVALPGDNENIPEEIFRYCDLLRHVDMVIPFIFNKEARSLLRNALSFIYRFIINSTFHVNFNYTNGTVLYRRSILKELKFRSQGFFFQTDILIRVVKKGYLFAEVPYRLGARKEGVSKAVSFPSLLQVIKGYLRLTKDYYFNQDLAPQSCFQEGSQAAVRRGECGIV